MNRKLALILSLIYCGFGQIYKGEVWKGVNFVIIYTALILSLIFIAPSSQLAQLLLIFMLILMWLTGMIDAYADDKIFIESDHGLLWKTLIMWLIIIGVFGSITTVTLLVVRPQLFTFSSGTIADSNKIIDSSQPKPAKTEKLSSGLQGLQNQTPKTQMNDLGQEKPIQNSNQTQIASSEKSKKDTESENTGYYTVQVGVFAEISSAEELTKQLKEKGYSVSVVSPLPNENPALYRVQVGKFDNKDSATRSAEKLSKYKGVTNAIVLFVQSD